MGHITDRRWLLGTAIPIREGHRSVSPREHCGKSEGTVFTQPHSRPAAHRVLSSSGWVLEHLLRKRKAKPVLKVLGPGTSIGCETRRHLFAQLDEKVGIRLRNGFRYPSRTGGQSQRSSKAGNCQIQVQNRAPSSLLLRFDPKSESCVFKPAETSFPELKRKNTTITTKTLSSLILPMTHSISLLVRNLEGK